MKQIFVFLKTSYYLFNPEPSTLRHIFVKHNTDPTILKLNSYECKIRCQNFTSYQHVSAAVVRNSFGKKKISFRKSGRCQFMYFVERGFAKVNFIAVSIVSTLMLLKLHCWQLRSWFSPNFRFGIIIGPTIGRSGSALESGRLEPLIFNPISPVVLSFGVFVVFYEHWTSMTKYGLGSPRSRKSPTEGNSPRAYILRVDKK